MFEKMAAEICYRVHFPRFLLTRLLFLADSVSKEAFGCSYSPTNHSVKYTRVHIKHVYNHFPNFSTHTCYKQLYAKKYGAFSTFSSTYEPFAGGGGKYSPAARSSCS